jgi:RNA polymerase sigma-70 factor, ECF subfamily
LGYTSIDKLSSQAPHIEEEPTGSAADPSSQVRAVSADLPSLRQIFDENAPYVWRTLRHLGIGESDIEDVCQEVFVTVHRKLEGFEGRSTLRTWLYGICLRVASDHRRRAYVRRELATAEPVMDPAAPTQLEDLARSEARRTLHALLDRLDDDKRAVIVLYELEELTMKEVAEIVGCPLQTAYSRLHAGRKILADAAERLQARSDR